MSISLYDLSVPALKHMLGGLNNILTKAEAHAEAHKIDPAVLLQTRLFPDMFAFTRQVQLACDFAKGTAARLAGVEVPKHEDTEQTFAELHARIAKTVDFIGSIDPALFAGSEAREIIITPHTRPEMKFTGAAYLTGYALPQFYFHITTAYAILRSNGVELGKLDYMNVQ